MKPGSPVYYDLMGALLDETPGYAKGPATATILLGGFAVAEQFAADRTVVTRQKIADLARRYTIGMPMVYLNPLLRGYL